MEIEFNGCRHLKFSGDIVGEIEVYSEYPCWVYEGKKFQICSRIGTLRSRIACLGNDPTHAVCSDFSPTKHVINIDCGEK